MDWNEPGRGRNNGDGSSQDDNPWADGGRRQGGGREGSGRRGGAGQGPPDLDEIIRNISAKLGELFGFAGRGSGGRGGSGGGVSGPMIAGLGAVVVVAWAAFGIYKVDEAERGVVLRFGVVQDELVLPGLHWNPPIVDEVNLVNVSQLNAKTYENRAMLTTDENIIDIAVTVQYRIQNPVNYVIAVSNPESSLDNAAESAIRHVVGGNFMDQILTTGRSQVADDVQERLQDYMDAYLTGIQISQVNVVDAQPPDAVRPAFDDVIRAREDEQRAQNQAQQYANRVIPEARGEAQRQIEQANAYRREAIARATGDAARFEQLLTEYEKAPEVTRQRLYIESMQDVMTASSKIMIDVEGGNNMLYVPLDKILEASDRTLGRDRPTTAQEWRDLANELAPYLPAPNTANTVNNSRLGSTGRGARQ